ncbi:hypothetical protein [Clostridium sp. HMP27]|uniref:hypothetical protein n=1 Tax=Clostridium sp. HMP27 TaxID=1487921 RepID=UPI00052DD033|nr:hypothetical protein [Clostridium sp. HMP27]KGK85804.1 hypothetical protein DP68_15670 [Clostridium sp. HMP27]
MKKDKALMICLISVILFSVFFMIILIYYNDIIIVTNKFFKSTTKEYWDWYSIVRLSVKYESIVLKITYLVKTMFSLIFILELFYIISNDKYIKVIGKRKVVISSIIGFTIYCSSFIFIKYKAEHYRLFMSLISTELLSLVVLNLVLTFKKENKHSAEMN